MAAAKLTAMPRTSSTEPWARGRHRRVLVLTSGLGSGHVRAAEAIIQAWHAADATAVVQKVDFWSLMDRRVAHYVQQGYHRLVVDHSALYERIFNLSQTTWDSLIAHGEVPKDLQQALTLVRLDSPNNTKGREPINMSADRSLAYGLLTSLKSSASGRFGRASRCGFLQLSWSLLSRRLAARVRDFGSEVVVATQMFPAALLAAYKRRSGLSVPIVGVLTDYGVHSFWLQDGIDYYCVPDPGVAQQMTQAGVPTSRTAVTGIPLMPGFRNPPSRLKARRALGLDQRPTILIVGGGLGIGLEPSIRRLAVPGNGWQLLVVMGRNPEVREDLQRLSKEVAPGTTIRLFGWVDKMDVLIGAADVVVGKPGGLTVAETLACGRPLVSIRSLRGQESFNVRYLETQGLGGLVQESELHSAVAEILGDSDRLAQIHSHARELARRDAAQRVVEVAERLAEMPAKVAS